VFDAKEVTAEAQRAQRNAEKFSALLCALCASAVTSLTSNKLWLYLKQNRCKNTGYNQNECIYFSNAD